MKSTWLLTFALGLMFCRRGRRRGNRTPLSLCALCLFNFLAEDLLACQVTALHAHKPTSNFCYSENMLATEQALSVKEISITASLWHSWARVQNSYIVWWRGRSGDHGRREGGTIPVIFVDDLWQPWGWTTQISFKRGGVSTDTL